MKTSVFYIFLIALYLISAFFFVFFDVFSQLHYVNCLRKLSKKKPDFEGHIYIATCITRNSNSCFKKKKENLT